MTTTITMTDAEKEMRAWLESGDPRKVRHARARIAVGFAPPAPPPLKPRRAYPPPPEIPPGAAASPKFEPVTREQVARINACPDRDCKTGCEMSTCRAGKGDRPFGGTTLANCRACLARGGSGPPDPAPLYARFGRRTRLTLPPDCGVLAAADAGQFVPLQLMLCSLLLSHDAPCAVADLGLDPPHRDWLARQGVAVLPEPDHPFGKDVHYWQSWVKPYLIRSSPFRRTLWLDADTLVDGDLNPLFAAMDAGPLLTTDAFSGSDAQLSNAPALYERFPVPSVCRRLNAGVCGFDLVRDGPVVDEWAGLLDLAAADPGLRESVRWYDQGALIWAAGKLGLPVHPDARWNRPGRAHAALGVAYPTPADMLAALPPKGENTIYHFLGLPKPYGWRAPLDAEPAARRDLRVFVLGHTPERLAAVPPRTFLEPSDLNATGLPNFYAEARFFLALTDAEVDSWPEYVGFATQSWDRKYSGPPHMERWGPPYPRRALPLAELHRLPLRPGTVFAADPHYGAEDWADVQDRVCPGMRPYIETIRAWNPPETRQSFWSNNFVCHKSVFRQFLAHFRTTAARIRATWGDAFAYAAVDPTRQAGYIYESIGVNYWGTRDDLDVVQCLPSPPHDPAPQLADGPFGGCVLGENGDPCSWTPALWRGLVRPGARVLDLGCGLGHAARFFRDELRCDVVAADGSRKAIGAGVFPAAVVHDLGAAPFRAGGPPDVAWCCEVAEHVAPAAAGHVVDSLARAETVLFTHALPNQPGHHHVNCQPPDYWAGLFASRGYRRDEAATARARSLAASDRPDAHFARTGVVFVRPSAD